MMVIQFRLPVGWSIAYFVNIFPFEKLAASIQGALNAKVCTGWFFTVCSKFSILGEDSKRWHSCLHHLKVGQSRTKPTTLPISGPSRSVLSILTDWYWFSWVSGFPLSLENLSLDTLGIESVTYCMPSMHSTTELCPSLSFFHLILKNVCVCTVHTREGGQNKVDVVDHLKSPVLGFIHTNKLCWSVFAQGQCAIWTTMLLNWLFAQARLQASFFNLTWSLKQHVCHCFLSVPNKPSSMPCPEMMDRTL